MKKIQVHSLHLLLLALLLATAAAQSVFSLNHPSHEEVQRRHSLAGIHRKFVIHHDMRAFAHEGSSHLSHEAVRKEDYGLNDMGYYFTINLTIGGLPYSLNIDTGSSDLFIKGEQSKGAPAHKYSCAECLKGNAQVKIAYLDGELRTYKAFLPVQLGPHKFNEFLLVAYTAPHNFEAAQGLLGLSFPELARNREPTFLQTLINNKIISDYAFGVNLNFQQHHRSQISFGSPLAAHYQGSLKKYKLLGGYSYSIQTKGVRVGNSNLMAITSALLDTGNTCVSIPDMFSKDILKQFNTKSNVCGYDEEEFAPQFSLLRCKVGNYDELPVLKIFIGQEEYVLDKDVYMQRCIKKEGADLCDTFIESVKRDFRLFLGDGFFNRYYAFFDLENKQIGLAKNREQLSHSNVYIAESEMDEEDRKFFDGLKQN